MSQLLLDVGNSRLKWALADAAPGGGGASTAVEHGGDPAAALSGIVLPAALRGTIAWAANVTGAVHEAGLRQRARDHFDIDLRFASVATECSGLSVAYADPSRLGVDRWLQMLALWSERKEAFVVASAGTALTFDAVDGSGRHLGGIIAPGLLTAQQAVLGATRFSAGGPQDDYTSGLGTDTEACVRQGALHACAGLLERLAGQFAGTGVRKVLSGGDAPRLIAQLEPGWLHRHDLVLCGLQVLAGL